VIPKVEGNQITSFSLKLTVTKTGGELKRLEGDLPGLQALEGGLGATGVLAKRNAGSRSAFFNITLGKLKIAEHDEVSHDGKTLTVTVSSFGFARGMPPVADLVFDMRFLANPYWVDELRPMTGRDAPVGDYIRRDPAFAEAFERIRDLLLLLLGRFEQQGKAYVNIAFGCTGGKHRSVFMAEQIASALREAGFSPTLLHRNLGSRAADLVERSGAWGAM